MQPEAKKIPQPQDMYQPDQIKGPMGTFDLVTHIFDGRGRLHHTNGYRLFREGQTDRYERPVGSGNLWDGAGNPAGRLVDVKYNEKGHILSKKIDPDAAHVAWTKPPTGAELAALEVEQMKAKIQAYEAELSAIKAEQEKKAAAGGLGKAQAAAPTLPKPTKE